MRPLTSLIFLGALSLPTLAIATTPAFAVETATSQVTPPPAHPDHGDDRPRIEEHHEALQGIELFILGGAFVAALGIAYRVGKISTSRKTNSGE